MPGQEPTEPAPFPTPLIPSAQSWMVAWTHSHAEHALEEFFAQRQVPCFVPRIARRRVYRSGIKAWTLPLFSGYVFYDGAAIERHRVFESRKVAEILQPPDPKELDRELGQIARAISIDGGLRESRIGKPGKPVYVARGPMAGLSGELVSLKGATHLVLRVSFLGKAAELKIDEAYIEPL